MKEDNKIFWKFIKSKTKAKESIPCILDLFCGLLLYLYFFQNFLFFTSAILLSSFIQGVSYFLDIDLLSGMFSSYIIFNSSANLCQEKAIEEIKVQ
jgi:hypothetical protein